MKCKACNGIGYLKTISVGGVPCSACNGTEEIVQTNKEYMRTCSDDELVTLLCKLVDSKILQEWRIKYHCADSDEDAVRMWLQEEHYESV